jgi:ABC-type sugar transport system substrate-binding protein
MLLGACAAPATEATTQTDTQAETTAPEATEPAAEETATEEPMKIGFVVKVINPFFTVMIAGAQAKADELGVELLTGAASEQTKTENRSPSCRIWSRKA